MPGERTRVLPVLVGAGQAIDRAGDPASGREPLALMEEAARRAAEDAGSDGRLLGALDTIAVVNIISWDYGNAPGILAERLGCHPARTIYTTLGGNTPQALVNHFADEMSRRPYRLLTGVKPLSQPRDTTRRADPVRDSTRP